mmetsp:Transcript_85063/g.245985  ORF Transcript_85063/g.245985 Transcript_85063/m.245985 type:complete len:240 (+) Transcript_85063:568-1287(+)
MVSVRQHLRRRLEKPHTAALRRGPQWREAVPGRALRALQVQREPLPAELPVLDVGRVGALLGVVRRGRDEAGAVHRLARGLGRQGLPHHAIRGRGVQHAPLPGRLHVERVVVMERCLQRLMRQWFRHAEAPCFARGGVRRSALHRSRGRAARLPFVHLPGGLPVGRLGGVAGVRRELRRRHEAPEPGGHGGARGHGQAMRRRERPAGRHMRQRRMPRGLPVVLVRLVSVLCDVRRRSYV